MARILRHGAGNVLSTGLYFQCLHAQNETHESVYCTSHYTNLITVIISWFQIDFLITLIAPSLSLPFLLPLLQL